MVIFLGKTSFAHPDPHESDMIAPDPDAYQSDKLDPDPHQFADDKPQSV